MFQERFGVYTQGVGVDTAVRPAGWRDRLVRYTTAATGGVTALYLDPIDLVVAKLVANRAKDRTFCAELVDQGVVAVDAVAGGLHQLDRSAAAVEALEIRLRSLVS